jgi:spermidine/putrescine transport system ATP-binding protein
MIERVRPDADTASSPTSRDGGAEDGAGGPSASPAISLISVRKTFGALVAVNGIDLKVPRGEFFSIIGPSGCGKTTTLRMIAGFEEPTSGTILVGGRDVTRVRPYRRSVNTVFQSYALFPHLDVSENIAFGLREARRPRDEIARRVSEAVTLVRLQGRERARPSQLSGGQQQRVALARAIINRPDVLLLDEPLGALDLKLRADLQTQLKDLHRAVGITFCYVTHDQGEAFSMSDRVAVMHAGVLEQVGAPEDVYRRPRTAFVADFVGASNRLPGRVVRVANSGLYAVVVDGLGERVIPGVPGLRDGTAVVVVVRPEDLQVHEAAPDAAGGALPAVVRDVAFLGAQRTVRLISQTLGPLVASTGGGVPMPERGAEVGLSFREEHAWLVPVERAKDSDDEPGYSGGAGTMAANEPSVL